jgi:phage terminase large subunit-like protein
VASVFDNQAIYARHSSGQHVQWFIESHCTFTDGAMWGQPKTVEPWKAWALNRTFEVDPDTEIRTTREAIWMVPRGNDKSGTGAEIGFYGLTMDGEGAPEVYSAARSAEQAGATFNPARIMWAASPRLQSLTKRYTSAITCPKTSGTWKVVSSVAASKQGTKPHYLLNDEYHLHRSDELRDAFIRGMHKRVQPLAFDMTTEAGVKASPLGELQSGFYDSPDVQHEEITPYLHVYRVRRSLLIRWGIPWGVRLGEVDLENPEVVRACNPGSWIDVEELIQDELLAPGKRERDFARYHCNMMVEEEGDGLDAKTWDSLACPDSPLEPGQPVVLGVDIGIRDDHSAIVAMGLAPDGRLHAEATILKPPEESDRELDYEEIDAAVSLLASKYRVKTIVADGWGAQQLIQGWIKRGIPTREFRFQAAHIGPASQFLLVLVDERRMTHDGSADFREHVLNMRMIDKGAWWRWDKPADKSMKIDAGMALCMAASEFMDGDVYSLADGLAIV